MIARQQLGINLVEAALSELERSEIWKDRHLGYVFMYGKLIVNPDVPSVDLQPVLEYPVMWEKFRAPVLLVDYIVPGSRELERLRKGDVYLVARATQKNVVRLDLWIDATNGLSIEFDLKEQEGVIQQKMREVQMHHLLS